MELWHFRKWLVNGIFSRRKILRIGFGKLSQNRRFSFGLIHKYFNRAIPKNFFSINAPAKYETPFISWHRSAFKELNDWAHNEIQEFTKKNISLKKRSACFRNYMYDNTISLQNPHQLLYTYLLAYLPTKY